MRGLFLAPLLLAGCDVPNLGTYWVRPLDAPCTAPGLSQVVLDAWDDPTFTLRLIDDGAGDCNSNGVYYPRMIQWCQTYQCAYEDRVPGAFTCEPKGGDVYVVEVSGYADRRFLDLVLDGVYEPRRGPDEKCTVTYQGLVDRY